MNSHDSIVEPFNNRILVIDDNPAIHEDFRKVLGAPDRALLAAIEDDEAAIFGEVKEVSRHVEFEIESAFQGADGLEKVRAAAAAGRPFAMAFVDIRMPPGWDGIETILHIWKEFPEVQMVICTAYSDYSWDQIAGAVGATDSILILKKPFDSVEALQIAHTLTRKWQLARAAQRQMATLDELVQQRTAELSLVNERLQREVAERRAAEEALRGSEERFSKAFRASPLPMCIQHLKTGVLVDGNASFEALTGYSRAEWLASDAASPQLWSDPQTVVSIRELLASHQVVRGLANSVLTRNGELLEVLVFAEQLVLGSEPHLLVILEDITDRVRLEAQLRQSQKMEAVGQLAAGIAHDFNNLLTVILGNASMLLHKSAPQDFIVQPLEQVMRASERAALLTGQLLAYSRKQIIQRRVLDLKESVEESLTLLRRVIGEHISVETDLSTNLPPVYADPTSVNQIVMNLALNARDAMPAGGRLTFSTRICEATEEQVALHPEAQPGSFVCLTVTDTGCGMDSVTLSRIFEPFFTTKEQGKGTGMGLATVHGIAQQHNGWIEVESARQVGTTFRVYFPICENIVPMNRPATPEPLAVVSGDQPVILVVEDEEMLLEFVHEVLAALGYVVLSATNGREALRIWDSVNGRVDLLFTDIVMPDSISGWQLARQLTEKKPELKVIYTSGYSAELISPEFEKRAHHQFLAKPFLTESLARVVASVLSSSETSECDLSPSSIAV